MKKITFRTGVFLLCLWILTGSVFAAEFLVPVGQVVGLELGDHSVTVAAYDDIIGGCAKKAGLQIGDEILKIDGQSISVPEEVRHALDCSDGSVDILVNRGGNEKLLTLQPEITEDGPRLGVYLRRGVTGIGTVTWYNAETGQFGCLGHGVCDAKGGLLQMEAGSVYPASVVSVKKGAAGEPGQLRGAISEKAIGHLKCNTAHGVFGTVDSGWTGGGLPVADYEEIETGRATIRSTVSGNKVQDYSVEILKIYPQDRQDGRNFVIKVTDPELLDQTGGIVQGMSGSPIIQNGKLIGAVTHVLVKQPDTGYGIFVQNMLDAAG